MIGRSGGCNRAQGFQQLARIVVNRPHPQALENLRERPLHQIPVFKHIGDARWHAQIVFQDVNLAVSVPHQIGSRNVAPHAARRIDAQALFPVERRRMNHFFRDDLVLQDLLVVIDVVDESVEGMDALLESALDPFPFLGAHDPGNQVERENALGAGGVAVNVECDSQLQQQALGRALAAFELPVLERLDGFKQQAGLRARHSVFVEHLVMETIGLVVVKLHFSLLEMRLSKLILADKRPAVSFKDLIGAIDARNSLSSS